MGQDLSGVNITNQAQFQASGFNHPFMDFSVTGNAAGGLFINITPVPEPATVLGLAAGVLGVGDRFGGGRPPGLMRAVDNAM